MSSTRSRGERLIPFDCEHNCTLQRMEKEQNPTNLDDGEIRQPPLLIEAHNHVQVDLENSLRMQPQTPRL